MERRRNGQEPVFTFERVAKSVTALEFRGNVRILEGFVRDLSTLSKKEIPFSLESVIPG